MVRIDDVLDLAERFPRFEERRPPWLRELDSDLRSVYYRFLFEYTRIFRPQVFLEIGTCEGRSAAHAAAGNPEGLVITLDVAPEAKRRTEALHVPNVVALTCDSIDALSRLRYLPPIDVLFIDGDHRFAQAYREYEAFRPFVRESGVILFDDIALNGEMRALWSAVADEKAEVPGLHDTGFGVATKSSLVTPRPLAEVLEAVR